MVTAILELIMIGAKIFNDERRYHFEKKVKDLLHTISSVEDSDFYSKDMEAKGKAERELLIQTEELRKEFVKEASK